MPIAMALLQCIVVGGWGYHISCKVSLVILASFVFRNSALVSAYDANAAINSSTWHRVNSTPLRCMGFLSCGFRPRKKFPAAQRLAYLTDK